MERPLKMSRPLSKKIKHNSGLLRAAIINDIDRVKEIVLENPDCINTTYEGFITIVGVLNNETALDIAVRRSYDVMAKFLLTYDNVYISDMTISWVFQTHQLDILKILFEKNLVQNLDEYIYRCCSDKSLDFAEYFLRRAYNNNEQHAAVICSNKIIRKNILTISYSNNQHKVMKLFIKYGVNCQGWIYWDLDPSLYPNKESDQSMVIMSEWRSYLPEWNLKSHCLIYPKEFKQLVFTCLLVFQRLNKTTKARISKDIKMMLVKHIASKWREIKESKPNIWEDSEVNEL